MNEKSSQAFCSPKILIALLIFSTCFFSSTTHIFNLITNGYQYTNIFDNVSMSYNLRSNFLLKFDLLNTKFNHRFISNQASFCRDYEPGFNQIISQSQANKFFKLRNTKQFDIRIDKSVKSEQITCLKVKLVSTLSQEIEACVNLNGFSWFGGHESLNEPYWPINNQTFNYVPYVTGMTDIWGAVVERYWLSSAGLAIFFDDNVPLFVKHLGNTICFKSSRSEAPYKYTPILNEDLLEYSVCTGPIKALHLSMLRNFMSIPTSRPDPLMMKRPVFTTWNYFFKQVNQTKVLEFARQINANNYSISQLEIDDKWEQFYGDLDFDNQKFPNVTELTNTLHAMKMRVTLWVHPFCNIEAKCFVKGTNQGLWVKDQLGQQPALTSWWNGKYSAILDTTNPNSTNYFTDKLNLIKTKYGIDSFKFDAGETGWCPHSFQYYSTDAYPDAYSQNYAKMAANQNSFVEVRTAHRVQNIGLFYRILDRSSDWSIHDGLKSVITATLQFGLLGYPFVLPDIIGGNGDLNSSSKELFIRWTQLTAFLPAMQFGVPPWFFDKETNSICKKFVDLHEDLIYPYISALPLDGSPIIRPIWWAEPDGNTTVYQISDQFLVGDDILVAPVLDAGLTERQVYFPKGIWHDLSAGVNVEGPDTKHVQLNLHSIPYFVRAEYALKLNL